MPCFFVFNKRVTGTRVGTRCVRGRKRLNGLRRGDSIVFHRGYTNRTLTRRIEQIRVLDVFMGSGTTLVACEKLGLHGTGIEINEKYFDAACRRVEEVSHNR